MTKLVAVYGTLKRGFGNHRVLEMDNGEYVGTGRTVKPWTMYGGHGFPRVVEQERSDGVGVHVELFECPDVSNMDMLEGHPRFFERKEVEVAIYNDTEIQEVVTAWMYFHPPISNSHAELQEDGVWMGGY